MFPRCRFEPPGDHSFNITWNAGHALEADGASNSNLVDVFLPIWATKNTAHYFPVNPGSLAVVAYHKWKPVETMTMPKKPPFPACFDRSWSTLWNETSLPTMIFFFRYHVRTPVYQGKNRWQSPNSHPKMEIGHLLFFCLVFWKGTDESIRGILESMNFTLRYGTVPWDPIPARRHFIESMSFWTSPGMVWYELVNSLGRVRLSKKLGYFWVDQNFRTSKIMGPQNSTISPLNLLLGCPWKWS